ncbi:Peptidyl-prolyl cis-trans isomerase-like 4 [Ophidiomyces ophidiicola]|uniref:Peptidyl-prolyl cis-trans isomerase-like 4 n=1 Tax=Ophidiomyces ophidiicola TaxID=1387563 RepID=A0ACB8V1G6_9EURO|nr:Peptidyl-prolyl cis-trans isomerase-like 4 [Ophidiomyces ophidiicola]KAI1914846.1 Peptidyl-prolyl cis-trans isomerase-like 4 [Ophidiomyces ophidiicola]KAI1925135.1 Peptidyl-prolyl cis-trans isomerase-like 4 [Ophidiomyces ophidiicola]KAI1953471.1 Peptidyl-prolyl cis-trans isomerase-like 4 [Ophidiomyces ophidiicola]KAI1957459.1 Peptidyl-prolyl cis-trans isomerase-like 4 [Ophidiomyces ophidiicola]
MSVLLETSLGDIVVDLLVDSAPKACENFLKLCKIKYFNFSPIHSVQKSFSFQTGDPLGPDSPESDGGSSIWGILKGPSQKLFPVEPIPKLKHSLRGTVSMVTVPSPKDPDTRLAGSQFIITLGDNLDYLDGKAAIFGNVVEGFDVLEKVNDAFIDDKGRPLKDIRIKHTAILDDPFSDPPELIVPPESPVPSKAQLATVMIADDEELDDNADEESLEKLRREREARAQALTLEMVGDLPFAEVKPPENVLFVCKLNPVTHDEDLNLIFSRFGPILSCEVIRDKRTGDSLQFRNFRIVGDRLRMLKGQTKEEGSAVFRVWRKSGITEQLQISPGNETDTEWYLKKKISPQETLAEILTKVPNDIGPEVEAQIGGIAVHLRGDMMTDNMDVALITRSAIMTMNDIVDNNNHLNS